MLPRRIPKQRKRESRWRSAAHCNFVRSHECCVPECGRRPIEVAHIRVGTGAGMAQKPSDYFTISLCQAHHSEQHRGERSFEVKHGLDALALADEFARKSPRAAEIRVHRNVAND